MLSVLMAAGDIVLTVNLLLSLLVFKRLELLVI